VQPHLQGVEGKGVAGRNGQLAIDDELFLGQPAQEFHHLREIPRQGFS
jgi:hypothetical protein